MSIVKKDAYQKERDMIAFVIKNYANKDVNEHYDLYLDLTYDEAGIITKDEFKKIRTQIIKDLEKKRFRAENIRLEYHINNKLAEYHMDSLDILTYQIDYYFDKWRTESQKEDINMFLLNKISRMINELIELRGQYNLGTPVVMFLLNKMNNQMSGTGNSQVMTVADFNKYYENSKISKVDTTDSDRTIREQVNNATEQHNELSESGKEQDTKHSGTSVSGKGSIDLQTGKDHRRKEAVF